MINSITENDFAAAFVIQNWTPHTMEASYQTLLTDYDVVTRLC